MTVLINNNAASRLASSLSAGASTLSVSAGEGAKFPSPGASEWFPLTVIKASGALEVMRCTSRSVDVLTVTRAQEGTSAQSFAAGDRVELRVTAGAFAEFVQDSQFSAYGLTLVNDANASAAQATLELVKQTGVGDSTVGRLLINGAHGIGGACIIIPESTINDPDIPTGFYYVSPTASGLLPVAIGGYMLYRDIVTVGYAARDFIAVTTGRIYSQVKAGGTWQAWREVWTSTSVINEVAATSIASASTVDLNAALSNTVIITGTTTISSFGTASSGAKRTLVFASALTITYNAVSMVLPGAASLSIAAGDVLEFISGGAGTWRCSGFLRGAGVPVVSSDRNLAKAWVNFNGVGTVAILDSYNVGSITDNGVGDYTINFSTALANANYSVSGMTERSSGGVADTSLMVLTLAGTSPKTASSVRIERVRVNSGVSAANNDGAHCGVSIFGG